MKPTELILSKKLVILAENTRLVRCNSSLMIHIAIYSALPLSYIRP